jgi:transcriptional regulator with XRE-family HTH domain
MKQDFAEKLRKIRVFKNFSQEYVAEQIGVSLSSYSRYEGGRAIDFDLVVKLSTLYKMSIDELYHYGEPGYGIDEDQVGYIPDKVAITIELDGMDESLGRWIKKITAINKVIGTTL